MNPDRRSIVADREVQRPLKQAAENFTSLLVGQENPPTGYLLALDSDVLEALEETLRGLGFDTVEEWGMGQDDSEAADADRDRAVGL